MKKLSVMLFSLVALSIIGAQEISFGSWLESKGTIYRSVNEEDPGAGFGINEFGLNVMINGGSFGAQLGFGGWSEADWSGDINSDNAPDISVKAAFIWTDFNTDGKFKLFAGNDMEELNYSPNSIAGELFNDSFGLGLGKYDFQAGGNSYTGARNGLMGEFRTGNLTTAITYTVEPASPWSVGESSGTGSNFEDGIKDAFILNAKYEMPSLANIYIGFVPKTDNNALWLSAAITAIPNVLAEVKLEKTLKDDETLNETWISANIGYNLVGLTNIVTETNYKIIDSGNELFIGIKLTPTIPIIGLDIEGSVAKNDNNDDLNIGLATKISKSTGNVGTSLAYQYNISSADNAKATTSLTYGVTMYF